MNPELATYDIILVNSSGGKDSQAMLDHVVALASEAGVKERLVVVHADLGRVEWDGTAALAQRQAEHYGVRFEKVGRPQGDLLQHVKERGMWPSPAQRYCTSDHKRGQVAKVVTKLTKESRGGGRRFTRVLNCMGLRAQESPARAKKAAFQTDARLSNQSRQVDNWLPIHDWSERSVWANIKASGVEHHYAYDLGMPRLSCIFCIFAPKPALVLAGKHNPELLAEYVAVEEAINHTFKPELSMADIKAAVDAGDAGVEVMNGNWGL